MNKKSLLAIVVAMAALAVHAQSAQKISQIVESQQINYGQAAYIALTYDWGGRPTKLPNKKRLKRPLQKNG